MPDLGLARLSDHLFFVAVLCYAVAMLGYAAEFAFGHKLHVGVRANRSAALVAGEQATASPAILAGQRSELAAAAVLAGVGAGTAGGLPAGQDVSVAGPAVPALPDLPPLPPGGRAARRAALRAQSGQGPASGVGKAAVGLTALGWTVHVGSVISRGLAAHRVPWGDMYEFSSMISLLAVTTFLFLLTRYRVRYLGAFVLVPVVLYMGLAGTVLYSPAGPLVPALNSYWLKIHVVAAMGSSAIFIVGAVATVLYLIRQRWERMTAAGRDPKGVRLGHLLPPSAALDTLAYRIIAFAFPVWTFAIIAGAIWAEAAWGRYWGWDPKETWSFITWVLYAGYLHARATAGWKGRRAASLALVAFLALAIDYYAVNIWITGLHSYAGLG